MLFFTWHHKTLDGFDLRIKEMVEASDKYIEPNTVVLPIDCTNNWIMLHMADYIAIHKPMVNIMDYEPREKWFPIAYNRLKMPYLLLGDQNTANQIMGFVNYPAKEKKQIDYIFLFGNFNPADLNNSDFGYLKTNLQNGYSLIFTSEDKWIHIYRYNINI